MPATGALIFLFLINPAVEIGRTICGAASGAKVIYHVEKFYNARGQEISDFFKSMNMNTLFEILDLAAVGDCRKTLHYPWELSWQI
jgi:hypothetical protein